MYSMGRTLDGYHRHLWLVTHPSANFYPLPFNNRQCGSAASVISIVKIPMTTIHPQVVDNRLGRLGTVILKITPSPTNLSSYVFQAFQPAGYILLAFFMQGDRNEELCS